MTAWPNTIGRQSAVLNKLSGGLATLRDRQITAGEMDAILIECDDTTRAIERDSKAACQLGCQTRRAVKQGRASWAY